MFVDLRGLFFQPRRRADVVVERGLLRAEVGPGHLGDVRGGVERFLAGRGLLLGLLAATVKLGRGGLVVLAAFEEGRGELGAVTCGDGVKEVASGLGVGGVELLAVLVARLPRRSLSSLLRLLEPGEALFELGLFPLDELVREDDLEGALHLGIELVGRAVL